MRRLSLQMTDRLADGLATAFAESPDRPPAHLAKLQAVALAWVIQTISDEAGRRGLAGHDHTHPTEHERADLW